MRLIRLATNRLLPALPLALCAALAAAPAAQAQIASDDFDAGNPNLWGVEFTALGTHIPSGGSPGGRIQASFSSLSSSLPAAMLVPAAFDHPYRGDMRGLGATEFRFDRQLDLGAANGGTLLHLVLGNDGGTPTNLSDDAWIFASTGDSFQFGVLPFETISTPIPSGAATLPTAWDVHTYPEHPLSGSTPNEIWNAVMQDVSYIGIAMHRPWNGAPWLGQNVLSLDNFVLDHGANIGTNYCGPAALNSSGLRGEMLLIGSASAAQNELSLVAESLPSNVFGFFIAGPTQGFTMNAGGSAGNLCLAGAIGRYVGPGQVQNTGALGRMELPIDLTSVPTPNGFIALTAGTTWNFQAWNRDMYPGGATSNFTDGVTIVLQ